MATDSGNRERQIVVFVAMMAFTFQFDAALVTVSLPDMARELSTTSGGVSLVLLSYLMGAVVTFVPAGKLGDKRGLRSICLAGCVLATAGTILCAVSGSIGMLVFSRLLQGIGAGAFVATGVAMMPTWVSPERVGWGYGMQSLGAGAGMVMGVPAGGILSHYLSWQWIFILSVPLFAALLFSAWRIVPDGRHQSLNKDVTIHWDVMGMFAGLMAAAAILFSSGLAGGGLSLTVLASLGVIVVMSMGLLIAARRGRRLFSKGLFGNPSTGNALAGLLCMAAVAGGLRYVLPFYLEFACGLSVLSSSYLLLAYPAGYAPVSVLAGQISDRFGSRRIVLLATTSCAVLCIAFSVTSGFNATWPALVFMLAFGAATGLYFAPANRLIMTSMPEDLRGEAGGALSVIFNFGTLLGVALFEATMTWRSDAGSPAVAASVQAAGGLGVGYSFAVGALLAILAILLCLWTKPDAD